MSYHTLNNTLYQVAGSNEAIQEALATLSGCKMTKKQRKAFEIATVNADFVAKEVAKCQSICSDKVDEGLAAMQARSATELPPTTR